MAKGQTNPAIIADQLDRSTPAASRAALGAWQRDVTATLNAVLAKMDAAAAATVTSLGTTNVATLRVTPPEER